MFTKRRWRRILLGRVLPVFLAISLFPIQSLLFSPRSGVVQANSGPSAFCHQTDGSFTICPDGNEEWSDVTPQFFPESQAYLYADQADLDPVLGTPDSPADTFMLMYDTTSATEPLGPNEYVRVSFTTVEVVDGVEALEHYVIHIFTDGTIIFFEDGHLETDAQGEHRVVEIEGQRGKVGFGPTPNSPDDHVFAEFEIKLSATGTLVDGAYSPDPQFWGGQEPFTKKDFFTSVAIGSGLVTAHASAGAAAAAAGFIVCPVCVGVAAFFGVVASWYALFAFIDPPDPNFTEVAELNPPSPSPITLGPGVTQEVADAANALLDNQAQLAGQFDAWLTSNQRAQGAALAGDDFWETEQLQLAAGFATQASDSINATAALREDLQIALLDSGFQSFPITAEIFAEFQADVAANGLPSSLVDTFDTTTPQAFGLTNEILIEGLEDRILGLVYDGTDSFPEMLTNPQEIALEQTAALIFDEFARSVPGFVPPIQPGFDGNTLPANDDGSTGLVPIGFALDFFGTTYETLFVNNNGNVTFDSPLSSFTPFDLTSTNRAIIAPFFADVDTRVGNVVTYGQGTVAGRPAFGANWPGVGCFSANISVLNTFQMRLIDRSDIGPGDFDIQFGYDSIQWETGQASGGNVICQGGSSARVGYSNGSGEPGTFFEVDGSGIPGAFLDSNLETGLIHSPPLRFAVRSGVPVQVHDRDGDDVLDEIDNCPTTPNADQADSSFNGIGDFCETGLDNSTAAFFQAGLDGSTSIEPTTLPFAQEPELLEKIVRNVDFRVTEGLTDSAAELTQNLVASVVEVGLVPPEEADELVSDVLQQVVIQVPVVIIDEDSIDNGNPPNFFSDGDVNADIANIGLRTQLSYFSDNVGSTIALHTGEVGDEGWFALKTIPASWDAAGPEDGLRNYINASPGLGTGDDPEALLDKIPDVTPLRATGLKMLEGKQVCAVAYDSDISINYDPLNGSLKGANLGIVAFEVVSVTQLTSFSSSSLPKVEIQILDADEVCGGELELFTDGPEPISSSEPFDVVP